MDSTVVCGWAPRSKGNVASGSWCRLKVKRGRGICKLSLFHIHSCYNNENTSCATVMLIIRRREACVRTNITLHVAKGLAVLAGNLNFVGNGQDLGSIWLKWSDSRCIIWDTGCLQGHRVACYCFHSLLYVFLVVTDRNWHPEMSRQMPQTSQPRKSKFVQEP